MRRPGTVIQVPSHSGWWIKFRSKDKRGKLKTRLMRGGTTRLAAERRQSRVWAKATTRMPSISCSTVCEHRPETDRA